MVGGFSIIYHNKDSDLLHRVFIRVAGWEAVLLQCYENDNYFSSFIMCYYKLSVTVQFVKYCFLF